MSATLPLKASFSGSVSLVTGLIRFFQVLLMASGILLIVVLIDFHRGGGVMMERLQNPISVNAAEAGVGQTDRSERPDQSERTDPPAPAEPPAVEPAVEPAVAQAVGRPVVQAAASEPLTPRMRGALEFVSQRYRVSEDVLEPIFAAAEASARALHVDPLLVVAVIAIESRFNPFSESVVGARGLMQVMPRYHQDKLPEGADGMSFFDPVLNVRIGTRILHESITRHGGLVPGLQQFSGSLDDPESRYASKVLAEMVRLETAAGRPRRGR